MPGSVGESAIVRSMSTDFMAPLLRGVLTLGQERGAAVAEFWRRELGWHRELSSEPLVAGRPLAVLNATHVQSGSRVGFGFPRLPSGFLRPAFTAADLDPELDLDLADAVRMSANFPYGFEHALLGREGQLGRAEIIDGGVVDNTGLDTLALALEGLQRAATEPGSTALDEERRVLSQRVRDGLIERGLIVLEIDAGARPTDPSFIARQFPSISKPLQALSRAGHQNGSAIRAQSLSRLRAVLPAGVETAPAGVVRAGFHCTAEGDVITAWSLDSEARRQIIQEFKNTAPRLERALSAQYGAIRALHCLRDFGLGDDPSASPLATGAVNLAYSDYLEHAIEVDATQHVSAPGCRIPEDEHAPGPAERALLERLEALDCAPGFVDPVAGLALLSNADAIEEQEGLEDLLHDKTIDPKEPAQSAKSPNPSAFTPKAGSASGSAKATAASRSTLDRYASARAPEALGFIYLGQRRGAAWDTKYVSWDGGDQPKQGDIVKLLGRSHVRVDMPDENGQLAASSTTLPAGSQLLVLQVRAWGDSGFLWASVAVPPASASLALPAAKVRPAAQAK
jgi:hypothetical protein